MKILAIETSCDETAAAVIEDGTKILSNVVVSQIDIFAAYGGVIPEVAARSHLEAILPVIHQALLEAGITKYSSAYLSKNPDLQHKIPKTTTSDGADSANSNSTSNDIGSIVSQSTSDDIDAIAVTHTPGLVGSLLIGTLTARTLAILWHKPLYAVHHLKSHIYANWLHTNQPSEGQEGEGASRRQSDAIKTIILQENKSESKLDSQSETPVHFVGARAKKERVLSSETTPEILNEVKLTGCRTVLAQNNCFDCAISPTFPLLSLVISGGHTQILYMPEHNHFEIIGTTRDDAIGECFDKVAKILGLPYPGGPSIAKCALDGDPNKYRLPHPKVDGLDFSFSGLKTAVLRAVQSACHLPITTPSFELKNHLSPKQKADFAASFQATACDILLEKLKIALQTHPDAVSVVFAGGVSANQVLREKALHGLLNALKRDFDATIPHNSANPQIFFPEPRFTGDNAAMVGAAAYYEILSDVTPTDPYSLSIAPRRPLAQS